MTGWNPAVILAAGLHDRLAQVRLVDDDRAAAFERDGLAEQALQHRAAPLRVRAMAGVARQVVEQLLAGRGQRSFGLPPAQPRSDSRSAPSRRPGRSSRSAACRSTRRRTGGSCRASSARTRDACTAPGTTSALTRNAGTKTSWITSSDVMISFTGRPTGTCSSLISRCAVEVLELPHPLLADDVDVERLVGRPRHREEHARAPDEDHHRDEERDHRPGDLEHEPAVDAGADAVGRPPAVPTA